LNYIARTGGKGRSGCHNYIIESSFITNPLRACIHKNRFRWWNYTVICIARKGLSKDRRRSTCESWDDNRTERPSGPAYAGGVRFRIAGSSFLARTGIPDTDRISKATPSRS